MGLGESFIKNVFCDIVKHRIGSVVKVDLVGKDLLQKNLEREAFVILASTSEMMKSWNGLILTEQQPYELSPQKSLLKEMIVSVVQDCSFM